MDHFRDKATKASDCSAAGIRPAVLSVGGAVPIHLEHCVLKGTDSPQRDSRALKKRKAQGAVTR